MTRWKLKCMKRDEREKNENRNTVLPCNSVDTDRLSALMVGNVSSKFNAVLPF